MKGFFKTYWAFILILFIIFIGAVFYVLQTNQTIRTNKSEITILKDSIDTILGDIDVFLQYVEELENKTAPITVYNVTDTVTITPSGIRIDTVYSLPFVNTERGSGAVYKVSGVTSFIWDFEKNMPISQGTKIKDFDMKLNVETKILPTKKGYEINTLSISPYVSITDNRNNVVDEKTFLKKIPTKVSLGIHAGYGLMYDGVQPYVGIGVTYNFYELGNLFNK